MTPNVADQLASYLNLPKNRVAIRGVDGISVLDKENQHMLPNGPDFVTPIGIAISATENPLHYTNVYVNDRLTLMFQTKGLTVGDCLVQAGIDINKYYGKIGLSHIVEINGQTVTLRGEYGEAPGIYVNNQEATVHQLIKPEDKITIEKGIDGKNPHLSIKDVLGENTETIHFTFNGEKENIQSVYFVNGYKQGTDYIIQDKDKVTNHFPTTINAFLNSKYPYILKQQNSFHITLNGQKITIDQGSLQIFLNNNKAALSTQIKNGDNIILEKPTPVTVHTLMKKLDKMPTQTIEVTFNGELVEMSKKQIVIYRNEQELSQAEKIHNGDILTTEETSLRPFIFQDVFRYVDIELANRGNYTLTINDKSAGFHDEIHYGDQLAITRH